MGLKPQYRECFRTAGGPDPAPKSSGILLTPVKSDSSLVCDADATLLFTINHERGRCCLMAGADLVNKWLQANLGMEHLW